MEANYIIKSWPLTYDTDVYWARPIWNVEWRISRHVVYETNAREQARKNLAYDIEQEAKRQQWGRHTWRDEERSLEGGDIVIRRTVYLQPGFRKIEQWAGPSSIQTIRVMPRNDRAYPGDPVEPREIELRPLWYRGEGARGALVEDVLYVVFNQ